MGILSRRDLDNLELKTEVIPVPEWRTATMLPDEVPEVRIRELTGTERDAYEGSLIKMRGVGRKQQREMDLSNARAKLCARVMIDENGDRLYNDNEIHLVGKLPSAGLNRVFDAVRRLSGITTEDEQDLIGETTENFTNDRNGSSGSG